MPFTLKVPDHLADQAEGLIQHLQSEAVTKARRGFKYRRTDALLMALQKGLEVLERELTEIERQRTIPESREAKHG